MKNLRIAVVMLLAGCGVPDENDLLSGISSSLDAFSGVEIPETEDVVTEDADEVEAGADVQADSVLEDGLTGLDVSEDVLVDGGEVDGGTEGGFPGPVPALTEGTIEEVSSPKGISIQPSIALDDNLEYLLVFTGSAVNDTTLSIWGKREGEEPFPLHPADEEKRNEPNVCALAGGGFVAAWSVDTDGNAMPALQIGYTIIGEDGPGPERRVVTDREGNHWLGHVSCSADGGFVIAGVRPEETDPTFAAFSQRYDASGEPVDDVVSLNVVPQLTETHPVVGVTSGTTWTGWTTLEDGYARIRRALVDDAPIQLPTENSTGMAMGSDYRIPGAVLSLNTSGPNLALYWLPEEGELGEPLELMDDGALSRHSSAVSLLERPQAAAVIYQTLEGPDSRMIVSYIGIQGSEPLTVGSGLLPPYTPSIIYRGGVLMAAWTEPHPDNQYTVKMQRWQ